MEDGNTTLETKLFRGLFQLGRAGERAIMMLIFPSFISANTGRRRKNFFSTYCVSPGTWLSLLPSKVGGRRRQKHSSNHEGYKTTEQQLGGGRRCGYGWGRNHIKIYSALSSLPPYPTSLLLFPFMLSITDDDDEGEEGKNQPWRFRGQRSISY